MASSSEARVIRNISVRQLPTNRSGITLVWIQNISCSLSNDENNQLHNFNDRCFILYYTSLSKFLKYVKQARSREFIIPIFVSYPVDIIQRVIHRLQQYQMIQSIFILQSSGNMEGHRSFIHDNVHVCRSQKALLELLERRIDEIKHRYFDGGLFTTFHQKEQALKDVREDLASFVWIHTLKVLLMNMSCNSLEAKREMLRECRAYYRNDPIQLSQVNEFQRNYQSKDAIRWYTKPGFLYFLVNKALRSQDIWTLYKFRYFIMDLCHNLEELSRSQSFSSIQLYRGTKLNRDELKQLEIGCLISTNAFFSCSTDRHVAEMFLGIDHTIDRCSSHNRDAWLQFVLFMIDVDHKVSPNITVADVGHKSELPDENEMIFNFGSTFVINEISFDDSKCIWLIRMNSSSDNAPIVDAYEKYTHMRLQDINENVMLGQILGYIGDNFGQSLSYFHRLLRTLPIDSEQRPDIYYNLGRIYRAIDKVNEALTCFKCTCLLVRRLLPQKMFDYCRSLVAIGTIYSHLGNSERGIKLIEQALTLHKKSFPENHTETPFHLNSLGSAYARAKQFNSAISTLNDAEHFFQTKMPIRHQAYSKTLHATGLVYRALGDDTNAIIHFRKALCNEYLLISKNHLQLAATYYQLSVIYKDSGHYELALGFVQKALDIQSIKLPHNHSEFQKSKELLHYIENHTPSNF